VTTPSSEELAMHHVPFLEVVTNDATAVALEDSLRRYRAAEKDAFNDNVEPEFIGMDCGKNILNAVLRVYHLETVPDYCARVQHEYVSAKGYNKVMCPFAS
jgi:hypothetical protein